MNGDPAREPSGDRNHNPEEDEPPPFLGSWKRVYIAVAVYTVAVIVSLYVLTIVFNR